MSSSSVQTLLFKLFLLSSLSSLVHALEVFDQDSHLATLPARPTCIIETLPDSTDDTPVILDAFKKCGQGGNIIFLNQTYNINTVMNTTSLHDCEIDIYGTLLVRLSLPSPLPIPSPFLYFPRPKFQTLTQSSGVQT